MKIILKEKNSLLILNNLNSKNNFTDHSHLLKLRDFVKMNVELEHDKYMGGGTEIWSPSLQKMEIKIPPTSIKKLGG